MGYHVIGVTVCSRPVGLFPLIRGRAPISLAVRADLPAGAGVGSMRSRTVVKRTIYLPGGRKRSMALEDASGRA